MYGQILAAVFGLSYYEAPQAAPPISSEEELRRVETEIIQQTNAERILRGLPPLAIDTSLMSSARRHATWMTNARSLTHTSAGVAENIAVGQRHTGEAILAWMRSSGHRANMLNRSYTRMGAAAFMTPNGTIYWCQQFLK